MKTILIACALTIAVSTSAMASAVPNLDTVSVVNAKRGVIQVADKQKDKELAYDSFAVKKHKRVKSKVIKAGKPIPTFGTEKKRTVGRSDFDNSPLKRKAPHYKRKSPRQCKKGQTASCK